MTDLVRVLLVDDQELIRQGVAMLLATQPGMEIVMQAESGEEALGWLSDHGNGAVDMVLSDAKMPGMTGTELAAHVTKNYPGLPVLILTTFDEPDIVMGAVTSGACGVVLKDTSPADLAASVRRAVAGETIMDARVTETLVAATRAAATAAVEQSLELMPEPVEPSSDELLQDLTKTERRVALLVAGGKTNLEVARELCISQGTVRNHVSAILRKLQLRDRVALALYLQ